MQHLHKHINPEHIKTIERPKSIEDVTIERIVDGKKVPMRATIAYIKVLPDGTWLPATRDTATLSKVRPHDTDEVLFLVTGNPPEWKPGQAESEPTKSDSVQ
jgi:hypothetical protein